MGPKDSDVLCNLRFADDDVMLLASSRRQLRQMIRDVITVTSAVGLELHPGNTKVMCLNGSRVRASPPLEVSGLRIEVLPEDGSTMHLGRLLSAADAQDTELDFRIERA